MKIIEITNKKNVLEILNTEFNVVCQVLSMSSDTDADSLLRFLISNHKTSDREEIIINLTENDILIICDALNEICYCLRSPRSPIKISMSFENTRAILKFLGLQYKKMTELNSSKKFPCPCCGSLTLSTPSIGSFELCSICFWEDDGGQYDDIYYEGGANEECLFQARQNFKKFGSSYPEESHIESNFIK